MAVRSIKIGVESILEKNLVQTFDRNIADLNTKNKRPKHTQNEAGIAFANCRSIDREAIVRRQVLLQFINGSFQVLHCWEN